MLFRLGIVCAIIIGLGACSTPKKLPDQLSDYDWSELEKKSTVHDCVHDAINETLYTKVDAFWNSKKYNCVKFHEYRGFVVFKHIEKTAEYFCAELFEVSQIKVDSRWTNTQGKILIACKKYDAQTKRWWLTYDEDYLDILLINEITK